jgi:hypothetical protein
LIEHPACHRRIVEQVCVLVEARSIGSKGEGGKKYRFAGKTYSIEKIATREKLQSKSYRRVSVSSPV